MDDRRAGPLSEPKNKLSKMERKRVIETATSLEFRNMSPKQIVPRLADKGEYIASESTFSRVLADEKLNTHRGRAAAPKKTAKPKERVATSPRQVWSWDITYLRTSVKGRFFFLYLMLDIWSRKVVGWRVKESECTELAADLLKAAVDAERPDPRSLVLHADNGGPMKGCTMKATMEKLGVLPSFSRPSVSNDNPFSEAMFRTLKYCPEYPRRPFETIDEARGWVARFVGWYNDEHFHSSIGFVTPIARHELRDEPILAQRRAVYAAARIAHPERWTAHARAWKAPRSVRLNPDQLLTTHHAKVA